jgi:hypothetical protein
MLFGERKVSRIFGLREGERESWRQSGNNRRMIRGFVIRSHHQMPLKGKMENEKQDMQHSRVSLKRRIKGVVVGVWGIAYYESGLKSFPVQALVLSS